MGVLTERLETISTSRKIVSYFEHEKGSLDLNIVFPQHLDEVKEVGVNTLVFCVSESTLSDKSSARNAEQAIRLSREQELMVLADPWGVRRFFGGEGELNTTPLPERQCFCDKHFDKQVTSWLNSAHSMGIDGVFWDEPETKPGKECRDHNEVDIIRYYTEITLRMGLFNSVCIPADYRRVNELCDLAAIPWVDDIATDPYWPNAFTKVPKEKRLN